MALKYNEKDDTTLWSLLIEGNTIVLETLYKRHYNLLLNYGTKLYEDEELVKDCIQNLFVKLHLSKNLNATSSVRSYLLKSLKNILYDKLKTTPDTVSLDDCTFYIPIDDPDIEQLFPKDDEQLMLSKQLMKAYIQLPESQKTAIYLRYIKGLSYKEIADVLDMNTQSAMNSVSRALTKLRSLLKNPHPLIFLFILRVGFH